MYELNKLLHQGAEQMGIVLSQTQTQQLLSLIELLQKWNKIYNLTAISRPKDMLIKHILDSLSIVKFVDDRPLLDFGSGAGFPGLVISILKPDLEVCLMDSVAKKCYFMQAVIVTLKLTNVRAVHSCIEDYQPQYCFGQISARAFGSVNMILELGRRLLCADGRYILMKSEKFLEEDNLPIKLTHHRVFVPFLNQTRYLLTINNYD